MKFFIFLILIVAGILSQCQDLKKALESTKGDPYWTEEAVRKREALRLEKVQRERCPSGFCPPEPD